MQTIVFATQKGGSGNGALSIGLAVAAIDRGQRVAVIEACPQGTVTNWSGAAPIAKFASSEQTAAWQFEYAILRLRRYGFTVAVIDTAAAHRRVERSGAPVPTL